MTADTNAERIAKLEDDNRRLRRLLEQRDAPGELRHRLRTTLALLRAIVRRSTHTERDVPSYAAHLEDRLDAVSRAQALADQEGEVDLRTLLADELFQYGSVEGDRLSLVGPDVKLQPRVGQIFALAIHELAVNAVEHGALGMNTGRIEVSWSAAGVEPEKSLSLTWTEFGSSPKLKPDRSGFGTEVLTHMLAYDLKAETDLTFGPDRLQYKVCFPLLERAGRI